MRCWLRISCALVLSFLALASNAEKVVTYYYSDPQGNVLAETDANGNITARYDYSSFGRSVLDAGAKVGFGGHVNDDDVALIYMQQRYYDSITGRFLSTDPVRPSAADLNYFNRYSYTKNNPYRYRDPDGRAFEATLAGCALTAEVGCAPGAAVGLVIDTAIVIAAIAIPIYMNQDEAPPLPSPTTDDSSGPKTLTPGPYAGDSIPATGPGKVFTPGEREAVDAIGKSTGCHTCGTTEPGTKSGHFVPDHQPPSALNPGNEKQQLYPQCLACSRKRGGEVRQQKDKIIPPPPPPPPPSEPLL